MGERDRDLPVKWSDEHRFSLSEKNWVLLLLLLCEDEVELSPLTSTIKKYILYIIY